jgi:pilus assembly protein Flp/PilA
VQWVVPCKPGCLPTLVAGAEKPNSPSVWGARTALAPYGATHTLTKPFRLAALNTWSQVAPVTPYRDRCPLYILPMPPSNRGDAMKAALQALWREDTGQGLVEYALIIALVAVGLIAILLVLRNSIGNVFNNAATQLNNAPTNPYP